MTIPEKSRSFAGCVAPYCIDDVNGVSGLGTMAEGGRAQHTAVKRAALCAQTLARLRLAEEDKSDGQCAHGINPFRA